MYKAHSTFKIERSKGLPLWRYMDFWKFLSLINSSKLFFPNSELLGDQNEGMIPGKIFQLMLEDDKNRNRKNNLAESIANKLEEYRSLTLISSWTASEHENFAMWKMYAKEKFGIAIKTDLEGLQNAFLPYENDVYIGEVSYYDDLKPNYYFEALFSSFLVKHEYYRYESEVRCISSLTDEEKTLNCKDIPIDLNSLVKEIYISKFAENVGLGDIIQVFREEKKLKFNICISGVNDNWV